MLEDSDAVVVAQVGEIALGSTKKFVLRRGEREEECFAVNHGGTLHAFVNRCLHVPITMDWVDNRFMTPDGEFIQCATHGAWYLPDTGECISGPPCGKFLIRVPLTVRNNEVVARWPDDLD